MNTTTAFLCKKPVIGVAMWLMTLCATNQTLQDKFIDLGISGKLLTEVAHAPMDEQYRLVLLLRPQNTSPGAEADSWQKLLCDASSQPMSITLLIKNADEQVESSQTFDAACPRPVFEDWSALLLGTATIKKGKFTVELTNNSPLRTLSGRNVQVLLMGQSADYP